MRGRKPTPGPQKEAQGNPGRRPIKPEPQFAAVPDDECPIKLDPLARAEWGRVVPELRKANLLRVADYSLLARYCEATSVAQRAYQLTIDQGLQARIGRRPALKIYEDMTKQARSLGTTSMWASRINAGSVPVPFSRATMLPRPGADSATSKGIPSA